MTDGAEQAVPTDTVSQAETEARSPCEAAYQMTPMEHGPPIEPSHRIIPIFRKDKFARYSDMIRSSTQDSMILVVGMSGAGKSTFIQHLTKSDIPIGRGLCQATMHIDVHKFHMANGKTVTLVDTPGFDDATRTDAEVLEDLALFLATAYSLKVKLAGIIQLHPITENRFTGSHLKNLSLFCKLCGMQSLSNVVLATTKWDRITNETGYDAAERIEEGLSNTPEFWGDLISAGSIVLRQDSAFMSALRIVRHLLGLKEPIVLDIQRELIDHGKYLNETQAGQQVYTELLKLERRLEQELEMIHADLYKRFDNRLFTLYYRTQEAQSKTVREIINIKKNISAEWVDDQIAMRALQEALKFQEDLRFQENVHAPRSTQAMGDGELEQT